MGKLSISAWQSGGFFFILLATGSSFALRVPMTPLHRFTALLFGAALIIGVAAPAFAQSSGEEEEGIIDGLVTTDEEEEAKANQSVYQYDKQFRPVPESYKTKGQPLSILGPGLVAYMLLHHEGGNPGDFVLRVSTPFGVSGCSKVTDPEIEMRESPPALNFTIQESTATAKKGKRYAHYECDTKMNFGYTDIPLNRDHLMKKGINKIIMRSKIGPHYENLDMTVTDTHVEFTGPRGSAKLWFYPEGTVMLTAPAVTGKQDVSEDIVKQGRARGLVPLDEVMDDFEPHEKIRNSTVYFLDPMGLLSREIKVAGKPVFFGNTTVDKTFRGPQGEYKKPLELQLYAKIPENGE
jgi:hypothetical protein